MGAAIALASGWGLTEADWLVASTRKGQWLARKTGTAQARWIVRIVFLAGILLGLGLAANVIRPLNAIGP